MANAKKRNLDFTNVKEQGDFNPKHLPEGDYVGTITGVIDEPSKSSGDDMWTFKVALEGQRNATYPHRCVLNEKSLWKVRQLLVAAGITVPKRRVGVDPSRLVGKTIGVELTEDEYEGRMKSIITSVFDPDEAQTSADIEAEEDDDDDETPPPAKKRRAKAAPVEDDDDDDDEDEEEAPAPRKKRRPAPVEEDEDEDEPAPPRRKKKAKPAPVDEDDDEMEIEDL